MTFLATGYLVITIAMCLSETGRLMVAKHQARQKTQQSDAELRHELQRMHPC